MHRIIRLCTAFVLALGLCVSFAAVPSSGTAAPSSLPPPSAVQPDIPCGWWYPPPSCPPRRSEMLACSLWGDNESGPVASALESVYQRSEQWTDASSAHDFFFSPNYEEVDIHGLVLVTSPDLFFSPLYSRRSPVKSFFLAMAPDVAVPDEAPEVYYRFHDRQFYRHGKITGSRTYKAEAFRDRNTWRVDIASMNFGLVEICSRFKVDGRWVYSQHNYMHFVLPEDARQFKGQLPRAEQTELPADWPVFSFHTEDAGAMSLYSFGMGVRSELRLAAQSHGVPDHITVIESGREPVQVPYLPDEGLFAYTAPRDEVLENLPCILKRAVTTAVLPESGAAAVLSMSVSCTTWSGMLRTEGGLLVLGTAGLVVLLVYVKRRRFKYDHRY